MKYGESKSKVTAVPSIILQLLIAFPFLAVICSASPGSEKKEASSAAAGTPWHHPPLYYLPGTNRPVSPPLDYRQRKRLSLYQLSSRPFSRQPTGTTFLSLPTITALAPQPSATNLTYPLLDLERRRTGMLLENSMEAYRRGDLQEAIQILEKGMPQITSADLRFRLCHRLGAFHFKARNYVKAAFYMKRALELRPGNPALACNLAATQMTMGKVDEALQTLSYIPVSLITDSNLLFSVYFNYACAYALKGEVEAALDSLDKAAGYDPEALLASVGDLQLDPIRDHPRFRRLLSALEAQALLGPQESR
ncbi:MAG TPA: tetratricopeptide repeat protein [Lentisphaerae bacterium]|nr:tetratricopeptide repeat protein [Lentisphaerota bacterium]